MVGDAGTRRSERAGAVAGTRRGRPARLTLSAGAAIVLALAVSLGSAIALAGSSPVTYHACVTAKTGAIRIVSSSARCAIGQRKISWNSAGPRGPRGEPGRPGVVAGYAQHSMIQVALNTSFQTVLTEQLPAGSYIANVIVEIRSESMNNTADNVLCRIVNGSGGIVSENVATVPAQGNGFLALTGSISAGGKITVRCIDNRSESIAYSDYLTAIPVASLTGTT
jgi:hypothetical protein